MRRVQLALSILTLVLLVVACAPKSTPAPQAAPATAAWQAEWDKVLAAARQEGKVVINGSFGTVERNAFMEGMKKFGIEADASPVSGSATLAKVRPERTAGLYTRDVWVGGYSLIPLGIKAEGLVEYPLDPLLVLPDATDPAVIKKTWYQGKFWWIDGDHSIFITALQPRPPLVINTSMVKEDEIKSWRDLLAPKFKGKLVLYDPTVPGGGQQWLSALIKIMGEDFIRQLAKQELVILRDERQLLDWVALGKMAAGLSPDGEQIRQYEKANAPIKVVTPAEGGYMSAASSGVAVWSKAAHPNATKVFINWLTTKEGQELVAPAGNYHSLRLDVSTAHLRPSEMRQPDVKYVDQATEESQTTGREAAIRLGKEVIEPLIKK